jgi:hypothetical protein
MMISEAVQDITETKFGDIQNPNFEELEKYLKITKIEEDKIITMKNGAVIELKKDKGQGALMRIDIDINGKGNKPNAYGVDKFLFAIGNNGTLYPAGGDIYNEMYPNDETGSCTATIVENGYTIK